MRLSTKIRYGYRLMLELAKHWGNEPVALKEVADRQDISLLYLRQIIMSLETAGLVKSQRGSRGGYTLAKPPEQISLIEITQALEGPVSLIECVKEPAMCERSINCATRLLWEELSEQIEKTLRSHNLSTLRNKQLKLEKTNEKK